MPLTMLNSPKTVARLTAPMSGADGEHHTGRRTSPLVDQ
jgi:hypothetical protein